MRQQYVIKTVLESPDKFDEACAAVLNGVDAIHVERIETGIIGDKFSLIFVYKLNLGSQSVEVQKILDREHETFMEEKRRGRSK